ncbi:MAG: hypothetical protein ACLFM0_11385 [Spirochaetales bacterium]
MDFWQRMRGALEQGVDTSKDLFGKAKDRAQDLSRSGILRFELMQLEDQLQKQLAKLGHTTYDLLIEEGQPVTVDHDEVRRVVDEIRRLRESIRQKENDIARAKREEGDNEKA